MTSSLKGEFQSALDNYEKTKKKLTPVLNAQLKLDFDLLIRSCCSSLMGEYNAYTIYKEEETGKVYSLIYAFYEEKNGLAYEHIDKITVRDATIVHTKLKHSTLAIDYIFVVPYYSFISKQRDSVMTGAVVTESFEPLKRTPE